MNIKNIVFYYNSKCVGGAELLFIRTALYLASNKKEYNVYYVDYPDGFSHKYLDGTAVIPIAYNELGATTIPSDSLVIQQLNKLDRLKESVSCDGEFRMMYWGIHPDNLRSKVFVRNIGFMLRNRRSTVGKILSELTDCGVIQYMDSINHKINAHSFCFDMKGSPYAPVPVEDTRIAVEPRNKMSGTDLIHFVWLGRLSVDKYKTLLTFMNEMDALPQNNLVLHIIGTGECLSLIQEASEGRSFNVVFEGELIDKALDTFIDTTADIGLAMGTSNLEFGKRGVPAILRGLSKKVYGAGELNDYIITNEIKGFSLGGLDGFDMDCPDQSSFTEKVNYIVHQYAACAKACHAYVETHHSIKYTSDCICNIAARQEKLSYDQILKNIDFVSREFNKTTSAIAFLVRIYHGTK